MARRKSICGRSISHGPGSCPFWWESCPDKIKHCFQRYVKAHSAPQDDGLIGINEAQAEAWQRDRDASL